MSCQILLIFIKLIFFVPLRIAYLGLTLSLRTISFIICIPGFILLSRQLKEEERSAIHGALRNGGTELEVLRKEELVISNSDQPHHPSENSTDRQTRLWQSQQSWRPHIYPQYVQSAAAHMHARSHARSLTWKQDLQGITCCPVISCKTEILYLYCWMCKGFVNLTEIWYDWNISWMYMLFFLLRKKKYKHDIFELKKISVRKCDLYRLLQNSTILNTSISKAASLRSFFQSYSSWQ